jgi:hypothetical protein
MSLTTGNGDTSKVTDHGGNVRGTSANPDGTVEPNGPSTKPIDRISRRRVIRNAIIECDRWAMCADLALLGWSAINRCGPCVSAAGSNLYGVATDIANHDAALARHVTADELELLLNRARTEQADISTS